MYWWVAVHVIGAVLGTGAATVNDLLFMRAIGSGEEGEAYRRYHSAISWVAWTGVVLLVISAFVFWHEHPAILGSPKILVKIGLTILLMINAVLMQIFLVPKVRAMQAGDWQNPQKLRWVPTLGTFFGVLSLVSWYTALVLGAVGRQPWTALQILPWYAAALLAGWLIGPVMVRQRLRSLTR